MMRQRREDEKKARLEAEQESIDLYEQVAWTNRFEVSCISLAQSGRIADNLACGQNSLRERMNVRLQACLDRNSKRTHEGRPAGELEPVLPRMSQFGSCFSYWPRNPDE